MKKQTAVEWLYQELNQCLHREEVSNLVDELKEQLLEMEKEEILDAWTDGYSCGMYQEGLGIDYYNETYLGIIKEEE